MQEYALSAWLSQPIVIATVAFAVVIAVVGFLATADRRPTTRYVAAAGLFAATLGAGLQYL